MFRTPRAPRFSRTLPLLALTVLLAACGGGDGGGMTEPEPDPSTILDRVTVTPTTAEIGVGETVQLTARAISRTGSTLERSFSWTTSDGVVASVNGDGVVTALGAGTATITASVEGRSATATVTVPPPGPPAVPTDLAATALSGTEIRLRWNDNSADEEQFVVYRETESEVYVEIARVDADVREYVDTGLEVGQTYRYHVTAVNQYGESEPSAYAETRTLQPLGIETTALPDGVQWHTYQASLRANGGPSVVYTWSLVSGVLPDGLTLGSNGTITGRPLEGGSFPITVRVASGGETVSREVAFDVVVPQADATFDLELVYVVEPSQENRQVFDQAAARWESIITRGVDEQIGDHAPQCRPAKDDYVDDVRIYVTLDSIDGPGGTLGFAGPCQIRFQNGLPISGSMTFDTADVARLRDNGGLQSTILHEMGHVLGIGTLWNTFDLLDGGCTEDDPADLTTTYLGTRGNAAYTTLGGAGGAPIYNAGNRPGSDCGHWDETTFRNELMTPFLGGGSSPLSVLTIEGLADFGYEVDPGQADSYQLSAPSPAFMLERPEDELRAVTRLLIPAYRRTPEGWFVPLDRSDDGGDR